MWGSGARQGGLDSNLIHSGGEGIKSNLIPHVFCPGMEGGLDSNLISHGFRGLKFGFKAPFQCKGFIRMYFGNADCSLDPN